MNAVFLLTGRFKLADKPEWEPPEIIEVRFVYPSGPQAYEEMIQTFLTYLDSHEVKNWTLRLTVKRVFNYFEEISHGPPRSMPKKKKTVIRGRFENMFKEIEERLHLASFENPREAFWGCFIW